MSHHPIASEDVIQSFTTNAESKLDELESILEVLYEVGPRQDAMEAIFRICFSLKTLANACEYSEIVDFISSELDVNFNRIRKSKEAPNTAIQKSIDENLGKLRALVLDHKGTTVQSRPQGQEKLDPTPENIEVPEELLYPAVGQISIWAFHDIVNLLSKIQGYSEIIGDIYDDLEKHFVPVYEEQGEDEKISQLMELKFIDKQITKNVNFILQYINRLRSLRGKIFTTRETIDLQTLIKDARSNVTWMKHNISWEFEKVPRTNLFVNKDFFYQTWASIWRLQANWVSQHTAKAKVSFIKNSENLQIFCWLETDTPLDVNFNTLNYKNEGPVTDIANLFVVFQNVAHRGGFGLDIAELENHTSIVRYTLYEKTQPREKETRAAPVLKSVRQPISVPKAHSRVKSTILIVDDDPDLRALIVTKLSRMGYQSFPAENIEVAKKILQNESIDLVLADLFLSQESGLDLLKQVKKEYPELPFVFMSGANEDDVPKAIFAVLERFSNAFLQKPIPTSTLKNTLEQVLAS